MCGLVVRRFTHGQADETAFDSADGFPADATLMSVGGNYSNQLLPGVSKADAAAGRECARGCPAREAWRLMRMEKLMAQFCEGRGSCFRCPLRIAVEPAALATGR